MPRTKEQIREYMRAWHIAHREERNARTRAYKTAHREQVLEYDRKYQASLRDAALALAPSGVRCTYCGYDTDRRALQFDHINGNGYLARGKSANKLYHKIIKEGWPADLQILCANCNQIKKIENCEYGPR